jgi:2-iminobutanoate/2-iminopropanoate deaminase
MAAKQAVQTDQAPQPFRGAPYSQAIAAGGFVFVSGQVGMRPGDTEVVADDVAQQTEQVFANLHAILDAAGSGLDRIVKANVYLATLDDFQAMNEVYRQHAGDVPPARATVGVSLPPGILVEIEAIALSD